MIDDTAHLQRVMDDLAEGRTRELDRGRTYLITAPLVLHFTKPVSDARLLGNGAIIESQITDGSPIWRIDAMLINDWVKRIDFYDLTIYGSGKDGNGIEVYAPGEQGGISRCGWHNITVEGAGQDGWNFTGAIFESLAENCGSEKNGRNGVTMANTLTGTGILSAMRWSGGSRSIAENALYGLETIGPGGQAPYDIHIADTYFLLNGKHAAIFTNGVRLLTNCGFERNQCTGSGPAIWGQSFGTLMGCAATPDTRIPVQQTRLMEFFPASFLNVDGKVYPPGQTAQIA